MLHEKKLPYYLWSEVVNTAVYLLNICPTKTVKDKTPFEAFSWREPGVKHLKVFRCVCYSHILGQMRHKLDECLIRGIFVGYGKTEKGYGLFVLDPKKIILSISVLFDKNAI